MEVELGLRHRPKQIRFVHPPMLRCRAMTRTVRRVTPAIVWLLIAAVISGGAAGLVASMAPQPGPAARAELTLEGDAAAAPGLLAATDFLTRLAGDVKQL